MAHTPGDNRLALLAQALLSSAANTLRPSRLPDRRYRSAAQNPTHDCAQLVVYPVTGGIPGRTFRGQAPMKGTPMMPGHSTYPMLPQLTWRVQLVQDCAPGVTDGPTLPDGNTLDDYGAEMLTDGADLWYGLLAAQNDGTIFGDLVSDCSGVDVGALTPGGYQGNLAWWNVDVAMMDLEHRMTPAP